MSKIRLIDANALLKSETERCNCVPLVCTTALNGMACDCDSLKNVLDRQQTIEAEPVRHGRWIPIEYDSYADGAPVWDKYECSECGHEHKGEEDTLTEFCPHCGARMDGGIDND